MRKNLSAMISLIIILIFTMSLFACSPDNILDTANTPPNSTSAPPTVQQPALPTITEVVAKVKPSVVAINVEIVTYDIFSRPTTGEGAGSGWITSEDGYIVTNNHVVGDAEKVTVIMEDGSSYIAEQVKTDSMTDLAVVKINANNLPAAKVGDSSKLEVGEWVVAIGNALGEGTSATVGVVSAIDVSVSASPGQTLHGLIQTDAAINPGNSGGPLVNMAGEVIGIDSIKVAQVGVEGMGYAISINQAMPIINELIKTGYIVRPWLGIGVYTVDNFVASMYNLTVDKGVLITEVADGSPAAKAGLEAGDVITMIEEKEIASVDELLTLLNTYKIGQTVKITFWRGGVENIASVTLGERPAP
ncbi:S1C family serine protease [Chloroflexota bacterium]